MRYRLHFLTLVLSLGPAAALAQVSPTGLISTEVARQFGLERMWFTHLHLDRGRGRIVGLNMHVSDTQAHTVFQIKHDGKRYVFSQRDRDAFGNEIGVEGAKQRAEERLATIKDALKAAGKMDPPPEIETFIVPQVTLYSSSERGTIHSLDAKTGRS